MRGGDRVMARMPPPAEITFTHVSDMHTLSMEGEGDVAGCKLWTSILNQQPLRFPRESTVDAGLRSIWMDIAYILTP